MNFIKDSIIILIITSLLFLSIEYTLRLLYPEKIESSSPKILQVKFDKDFLIALKPNMQNKFVRHELNGGDTIIWTTNKDSFRGAPLKKNPDKRIMVYGDSNILARFSRLENTFPKKLERYLSNSSQLNIEVINAGVAGFGPDQSLLRIKREVNKYNTDEIILHIFADNDFGDLMRNKLFKLDNNNLIKTNLERDTLLNTKQPSFFSSLLFVKTANKISNMIFKNNEKSYVQSYEKWCKDEFLYFNENGKEKYEFGDHYDFDLAVDPTRESSKMKIALLEAILRECADFLKEKEIKLTVLIQPSIIDITLRENNLDYEFLEQKYSRYDKTNLTFFIKQMCIKNNINYVNLFDHFINQNPKSLYFEHYDNHWNDLGQDLAAKKMAAYMIDRKNGN